MMLWRYLFSGTAALAVGIGFGRFLFTPMIPIMIEQTTLTVSSAGYLASINYIGYTLGALLPLLWRGDHVRIKALFLGLFVTVVAFILMSVKSESSSIQFLIWALSRFLNGLASAWIMVNISSLVLEKLERINRLDLKGVLFAGVGIGAMLSGLGVDYCDYLAMEWSSFWVLFGLLSSVLGVWIYMVWLSEKVTVQSFAPVSFSEINIPKVWLLALAYFGKGFSYIIVMTFLPVMTEHLHKDQWGSRSWLILSFCAVPSSLFWGYLSDQYGNLRCLKATYFLMFLAFVALYSLPIQYGAVICACLIGLTFMGIVTLVLAQAQELVKNHGTLVISLVTGIYSIGQVLSPGLAGLVVAQTGSFDMIIISAMVLLLISLWALIKLEQKLTYSKA
jgi:predicted MFS family arabinose efflux permease